MGEQLIENVEFRDWLEKESPVGLSAAQLVKHLVLQIKQMEGPLESYLMWSLQPPVQRPGGERELFPLPLWPDSRMALREIIDEFQYKDQPGDWRQRGETKSKAAKALRGHGLRAWHGLMVVGLNFLYGNRADDEKPYLGSQATMAQERALERIWELAKEFIDEKDAGGVPRTSVSDWQEELKSLKVSYSGEVIEKARPLTLRQILPGLPSEQHGASVNIMDVLPEELQEVLRRPGDLVDPDAIGKVPKPKVHCEDQEWPLIVKAMLERNLVTPVKHFPKIGDHPMLNGAFGVVKADKFTESGEKVLRLIIDLRSTNHWLRQIPGDAGNLTGAATFQRMLVEEGQELLVSGEDLTAAFYLFELPPAWSEFMVLEKAVKRGEVGLDGDPEEKVLVGLKVLPMGWSSSVGLMQAAHRTIALRSPLQGGAGLPDLSEISKQALFPDLDDAPAWHIYLDDTTIIEKVESMVVDKLKGHPPEEQKRMRQAYAWLGIPTNSGKALERVSQAERLGALINGEKGILRTKSKRSLDLISLGTWLRSQKMVPKKGLQVYAGKAVHILQFRRCLFSIMEVIFRVIAHGGEEIVMASDLMEEMLLLEALLPTAQFDLKARVDPVVTASDASETGGGTCFSSRLSRLGKEAAFKLMEEGEELPEPCHETETEKGQTILVVDLFAGIGGLSLALERAGLKADHTVFVEMDADCRRLLRRRFPGSDFHSDITTFKFEQFMKAAKKLPKITGLVVGGGSPCQGLSRLKAGREHLKDPRSQLFFEAERVFRMVEQWAVEIGAWCLKMLENVVADAEDVKVMSETLGMEPLLVEAGNFSRVRRPRLYWVDPKPKLLEGTKMKEEELYTKVTYDAPPEPLELVFEEGVTWPGEELFPGLKFPTFTRCIPRKRPPPSPAGLAFISEAEKERWAQDGFRYPPYTYETKYMLLENDDLRPCKAGEREVLMGYPRKWTEAMLKKTPRNEEEIRAAEDLRCAAIGNSFHIRAVAMLLDQVLASMNLKKKKGGQQIAEEMNAWQQREDTMTREVQEEEEEFGRLADDSKSVDGALWLEGMADRKTTFQTPEEELEESKKLSSQLVMAFVRRQEFRGCDVRLDVGTLYKPDSFPREGINPKKWLWHVGLAYAFKQGAHINELELIALVRTFGWRLRNSRFGGSRALHLTDSQVALAVSVKGRSSSQRLNTHLRRFASLQIAGGIYPLLAWVESELNPADAPSRAYE